MATLVDELQASSTHLEQAHEQTVMLLAAAAEAHDKIRSCPLLPPMDIEEIKQKIRDNQYVYSQHADIERKAESLTFVNVEEAQTLLRTQNKGLPFLLRELHHQGPKIVVISDGPQGSYTYDGKKLYYCPIYDVPVVERTGCGDSYATGFLSAIAYGKTVIEAMKWGTVNAASVIQQVGPQAGLIQQSLLQKILKANTLFQVRTFHEKEVTKNRLYKPAKYTSF